MSEREVHALSGAYALDALDELERARFQAHMANCSPCRAEVASLREAAAEMAWVSLSAPSATLRASVLRAAGAVRPLPPAVTPERQASSPPPAGSAAAPLAPARIQSGRAERHRQPVRGGWPAPPQRWSWPLARWCGIPGLRSAARCS